MYHQVSLLVERQQVLVLVKNFQRNRFRHDLVDGLRRRDHLDGIPFPRVITGFDDLAVYGDEPFADQPLHAIARKIRHAIHKILINTASQVLADAESEMFDIRAFISLD